MSKFKTLLSLLFTMMKIGAFTFGGGYAMLALLENEFVSKRGWMKKEEFLDMVAIAESTPGPIAINSATYIGYKQAGILGSAFATAGVCIPSFAIIYVISLFFDAFLSLSLVAAAFRGIQACVVYLIFSAGYKMLKAVEKKPVPIFIFSAVMLCMVLFSILAVKFSTVVYILISGAIGVFAYFLSRLSAKKEEGK